MRTIRYQKNVTSMCCAHAQLTFTMCFIKKRCQYYITLTQIIEPWGLQDSFLKL